MNSFIAFLTVIALAQASVFYSLNDIGRLQYGINDGSTSRQEVRTPDGVVRGTYTYTDGDGTPKTITYGTENGDGAAKAPEAQEQREEEPAGQQSQEMDTEAAEAPEEPKKEGADAKEEAAPAAPELPQPVSYTPEVAAARAAHFAARDQAIYLQQLTAGQQLLNQPIVDYSPFYKEYYGAAKHFRDVNPFYFL